MGILTEQQLQMLPLANALTRIAHVFADAPHLRNSENPVPGCGFVTWRDLALVHDYASGKFDRDGD